MNPNSRFKKLVFFISRNLNDSVVLFFSPDSYLAFWSPSNLNFNFLSVIIGIIFGAILIKLYKYLVGKEVLQKVMMRSSDRFIHIRVGFCVIAVGLSIVCAFLIAFYGMYELSVETYYWFCATFCSASISLSLWLISTNLNCMRKTSKTI